MLLSNLPVPNLSQVSAYLQLASGCCEEPVVDMSPSRDIDCTRVTPDAPVTSGSDSGFSFTGRAYNFQPFTRIITTSGKVFKPKFRVEDDTTQEVYLDPTPTTEELAEMGANGIKVCPLVNLLQLSGAVNFSSTSGCNLAADTSVANALGPGWLQVGETYQLVGATVNQTIVIDSVDDGLYTYSFQQASACLTNAVDGVYTLTRV